MTRGGHHVPPFGPLRVKHEYVLNISIKSEPRRSCKIVLLKQKKVGSLAYNVVYFDPDPVFWMGEGEEGGLTTRVPKHNLP